MRIIDSFQPPNYRMSPFSLDKEMLKKLVNKYSREEIASTDVSLLEDLPDEAHGKVKRLLRERNRRATSPYGWKIVAIEDRRKKGFRAFLSAKTHKNKAKDTPNWLIILRGGALSPENHKASLGNLPDRLSNPWQERGASRGEDGSLRLWDSESSSDHASDNFSRHDHHVHRAGHLGV
jgi:hypothetical protein